MSRPDTSRDAKVEPAPDNQPAITDELAPPDEQKNAKLRRLARMYGASETVIMKVTKP